MGQCCGNQYHIMGEEFISRLLQDETFSLKDYDYNRLLNDIVSKRIQQEIHKLYRAMRKYNINENNFSIVEENILT